MGGDMFGFSTADWLFIGFILIVIIVCVALSDMRRSNKENGAE
jgi:disulfide bond formation protein DsbB